MAQSFLFVRIDRNEDLGVIKGRESVCDAGGSAYVQFEARLTLVESHSCAMVIPSRFPAPFRQDSIPRK